MHIVKVKKIFQTLENRGTDIAKLQEEGPFPCKWDNTWLGDGYYFWDTLIENAHWWGEVRQFEKGYIICRAECDYNINDCLDLHGDLEQLKLFKEAFELMIKNGVVTKNTTVKNFLAKLRGQSIFFKKFTAIRVNGINSKSYNSIYSAKFFFEKGKDRYLEMNPPVQICFFEKNSMNLRNYKVVFPEYLIDGYVV